MDASSSLGALPSAYAFFGYDEPNYTYTANGKKLIGELAALSSVPVQIRTHHLLVTGDGTAALKWGSTNAYTEDANGRPIYDWTIVDRIFDTYESVKAKPFVEIGFMPQALSTHPQPYIVNWPKNDGTGWSYPPRDYAKWAELIRQWVLHEVARYGRAEVESWSWELWNEPDISYWRGTPEEYDRLYDYTSDAIKRALPTAHVGGPGTTGPASERAASYLRQFLEHCAHGDNAVTGQKGAPLDFVSYHAKGAPRVIDGHVRMNLGKEMTDVARGMEVLSAFPEFRGLPIVLTEADPEGCAACSAREHPENVYRNGTLYPSYTAAAYANILKLAETRHANLEGMLTWAFEFEGFPYFDGFRSLATNGIDKPVLNLFRMLGMMRGNRVKTESDGTAGAEGIMKAGVRQAPDIDALAAKGERELTVLVWNYHDDEAPAAPAPVRLAISGVWGRVMVEHFRVDDDHSNAYTAWKRMGSPQQPSAEQYAHMEAAARLETVESPEWRTAADGKLALQFDLPRHSVSLLRVSW